MKQLPLVLLLWLWCTTVSADTYFVAAASNRGLGSEPELRYAEQDARALRDVLMQFGAQQVIHPLLLLGADASRLEEQLTHLRLRESDTLYVYYSGHADSRGLHLGTTLLSFDTLKGLVDASPARMKLLIVDACASGEITRAKGARPAKPFSIWLDDRLGVAGTAIVTSSADSEDSQESDDLGASFFTFHLVQALRGAADRDRDRQITLNEAFGYAARQTLRSTALTHQLQHPTFKGRLFGHGAELVLSRLDVAANNAIVSLPGPGTYLIFDNNDGLAAEIAVEGAVSHYVLPAGRWLFQKRLSEGAQEQWLDVRAGEERVVSERDASVVPFSRLTAKGRADDGAANRLQLLGGIAAPFVPGHQTLAALRLGYRRSSSNWALTVEGLASSDANIDQVFGLHAHVEYGWNVGPIALGVGLGVDGVMHRQRVPLKLTQFYPGVGAMAIADMRLCGATAIRIQGGPSLYLVKQASDDGGATASIRVGWWVTGGPTWGF